MNPIEMPGITLHYLLQKWNAELVGGYIQQMRTVHEDTFLIKVHTNNGNKQIMIALPRVIIESTKKWESEEEQPGIVNATKKQLDNLRIEKITQEGLDRVITIHGESSNIIIELFGEGNLIVTDTNGVIQHVHHAREWKGRTLKMRETYKPPSGPSSWNELPEKIDELKSTIPFRTIGGWMVSAIGIPPAWTEEIVEKIGRKQTDENPLVQTEWKKLRLELQKKIKMVATEFEIVPQKNTQAILPILGKKMAGEKITIENIFERIEENVVEAWKQPKSDSKNETQKQALLVNAARQRELLKEWENKIAEQQSAGEWMYEHFGEVQQLIDAVQRGMKQKIPERKMLDEIKKKMPFVKYLDLKTGTVELELVK